MRAVDKDMIGNNLPTVVPFNLFEPCINRIFDNLVSYTDKLAAEMDYVVIPVPTLI